jgi:hypothetical protein
MKKARLVKPSSDEYAHNVEQSRREEPYRKRHKGKPFNPVQSEAPRPDDPKLVALDKALAEAMARYQHSLDNPSLYTAKQIRRLKRKAIVCSLRVKAFIEELNERKPDRKIIAFFQTETARNTKSDCKLPKRTGYGLRAPQKDNNPKRGRAVLPIVNPAYVVHRPDRPDPSKKFERDRNTMHTGYVWELPGYKKNKNGNGNGRK